MTSSTSIALPIGSEHMIETTASENALQEKVAEKIMNLFDNVLDERRNHFEEHPEQIQGLDSAQQMISAYSMKNAKISGALNLVPGPWGMLAAIPEIVLVIRNQVAMICDIGITFGKKELLNKELLAGVFLNALGTGAGTLLVLHGGKILVKRVSLRLFQRVVTLLAGKVTQRLLKSMIAKWLPIVGAAAMAAWSKYATDQIGKKAISIFEKDIEIEGEIQDELPEFGKELPALPPPPNLNLCKAQALISVVKVDGKIRQEEIASLKGMIKKLEITNDERTLLGKELKTNSKPKVDYSVFAKLPEESIALLMDLVALAKRDGEFHISEKLYIKQVGKQMGYSENDIDEILASA